jgi:hypothetical protein
LIHEFLMRALGDQTPLVEYQDAIHLADGGEPVSDDEAGAVRHQFLQGELNQALTFGVQGAGGLVQEEEGRIAQDGPGDGQVTEHRARKDVGAEIGATLDGYVSDVEAIKRFYSELLCCGPALDEYAVRLAQQERKEMHRDWLIALGSAVIGVLIGVLATVFLV